MTCTSVKERIVSASPLLERPAFDILWMDIPEWRRWGPEATARENPRMGKRRPAAHPHSSRNWTAQCHEGDRDRYLAGLGMDGLPFVADRSGFALPSPKVELQAIGGPVRRPNAGRFAGDEPRLTLRGPASHGSRVTNLMEEVIELFPRRLLSNSRNGRDQIGRRRSGIGMDQHGRSFSTRCPAKQSSSPCPVGPSGLASSRSDRPRGDPRIPLAAVCPPGPDPGRAEGQRLNSRRCDAALAPSRGVGSMIRDSWR